MTLYDDVVDQVMWAEDDLGVKVEGRRKPVQQSAGGGGGLLDLIAQASKAKTQAVIEEKRQDTAEPVVGESVVEIGS